MRSTRPLRATLRRLLTPLLTLRAAVIVTPLLTLRAAVIVTPLLLGACGAPAATPAPRRASLSTANGQWSVSPTEGQLPYCLLVQARGSELAVPLPIAEDGQSVACPAGKPIGRKSWPVPANNAVYKVFVVFSDRPLKGDTVAEQIRSRLDEGPQAVVTSMDLRAPGQVALETLEVSGAPAR
ncbi:MAG: hypothetical protein U0441_37790 [Polyangiaceae bacterium]